MVGATPFLLAASAGNAGLMHSLVAAGADPLLMTTQGMTPLMAAAGMARTPGETLVPEAQALEAVKLALKLGNQVNARDASGDTALHGAAHVRLDAVVQLLVDNGAEADAQNKNGETPLIYAERILQLQGVSSVSERTSTGDLLRKLGAR